MGPHQNRVTPTGEIVAIPLRGSWMGNRGILHDDSGRVLRNHASQLWITCALSFRGWRAAQWQPHHYTVLFFHDEAVSLAAGHRPCALCRREAYDAYRNALAEHDGAKPLSARRSTPGCTRSGWSPGRGRDACTTGPGPASRTARSSSRTTPLTSWPVTSSSGGPRRGMPRRAGGLGWGRRWCSPHRPVSRLWPEGTGPRSPRFGSPSDGTGPIRGGSGSDQGCSQLCAGRAGLTMDA
jgi:hypothetical protein